MARRIDSGRFFRDGRGKDPPAVDNEAFFRSEVHEERASFAELPATPWKLGALFSLAGFAAVFVDQAPFLYQLVLGAPIFEELFKFGLALLIAGAAPGWIRVPVALLIGAGFGWMEHLVTYADEPASVFAGRIAFHGLATGLSMVVYGAAVTPHRWWAPVPSIFVHYLNNAGALVLGVPLQLVGLGGLAVLWSLVLIASLAVLLGAWLVWPHGATRLTAWLGRTLTPSLRGG